jgi:hypothetical protein
VGKGGLARALCLLFFFFLCWPFLGVADRASLVLGVPSLLLYAFAGWGVLVAVLAAVSRRTGD